MRGVEALFDVLAASGVRYFFGNPGTTELPFNDALATDKRFEYILGLNEIALTAMADGYAMASGQPGVVCVHISCGLGNAMGMLYNAYCEGSPVVVIAGQQDRRLRFNEPILAGEMVSVASPWTKWACEVQRVEDVPKAMRRALQMALTPPRGPVFLSIPVDMKMEECAHFDLSPAQHLDTAVRPPLNALRQAADLLAHAKNPVILAGSRVTEGDAVFELAALAEAIGAEVLTESTASHGRVPMPADHPLYSGGVSFWAPQVRARLANNDVIFVAGMNFLRLYIYLEPENPVPDGAKLVQFDIHARELGKNYPADVALWGDLKTGFAELTELVRTVMPEEHRNAARARVEQAARRRTEEQRTLQAEANAHATDRPMAPIACMTALAKVLPANIAVIEEAITTHNNILEKLGIIKDGTGYFAHRGWALGWGMGCTLGVKLAWPERPVLGLIGDGSSLYSIQALWTAAHHNIPAIYVIPNNRQYKILKICGNIMKLPEMVRDNYLGLEIRTPDIDFVSLARAFGVEAHRATTPDGLAERVEDAIANPRPILIEAPIAD